MTDAGPAVAVSADQGTAVGPRTARHRSPPGATTPTLGQLARPAGFYVASRIVVLLVALVATASTRGADPLHVLGTLFDGRWYVRIAEHGYPHRLVQEGAGNRWAFFPGFPLVLRGAADATGLAPAEVAPGAAFVLGLSGTVAVWLAVRQVVGTRLADRTALLLAFFPTAYVFSLAYSEGLFLTAAGLCLYALARQAWLLAGLCAVVAGLTRDAGAVVVLAVVATALPAAWRNRSVRPAVGAFLAPMGTAAFMAYGWVRVGTPIAFVAAERFWYGQHFVWFVTPILAAVSALHQGPFGARFVPNALAGVALGFGFVGLRWLDRMARQPGLLASGAAALPIAWWIYAVGTLLTAYSAYFSDSILRYTMVAFPLLTAVAWRLRSHRIWPVVATTALLQAALFLDVLRALHPVVGPLVP